jgi:hypothetical protein
MHVCMCNKFSGVLVAGIMHLWRFTTHEVRIGWARIEGSILEIQPLFERSLGALFASSFAKNRFDPFNFHRYRSSWLAFVYSDGSLPARAAISAS